MPRPCLQTVADADGVEFKRCSASSQHAIFYCLSDERQLSVARHHLVEGVDHTDQWTLKFFLGQAHGFQQRTLRGSFNSFGDLSGIHVLYLKKMASIGWVDGEKDG